MNDRNKRDRTFNLGSDDIEEVTHYYHVGITLCSYLSSNQRTVNMCAKGSNILSAMTEIGVKRNGINPIIGTFLHVYGTKYVCLPYYMAQNSGTILLNRRQS